MRSLSLQSLNEKGSAPDQSQVKKDTHITAVEGELQKLWGAVSHHVLESIIIQPEIL